MDIKLYDIEALARDRELVTPELHAPNAYYGNAATLKAYAGLAPDYAVKAAIMHGPFFPTLFWGDELHAALPVLFSVNRASLPILGAKTDKALFSIGPYVHYAQSLFDPAALADEKRRLGKTLVVFPPHSTHHIKADYHEGWLCDHIERLGKQFHTILICLYWKDVLHGRAKAFRDRGFQCLTAGHIFDPLFLHRLKTILCLSDAIVSYAFSSIIGYAVSMNKPLVVARCQGEAYLAPSEIIARDTCNALVDKDSLRYRAAMYTLFAEFTNQFNQEQIDTIELMWGLSQVKTPQELRLYFDIAEEMFATRKTDGTKRFPSCSEAAIGCIEKGYFQAAATLLQQIEIMQQIDEKYYLGKLLLEKSTSRSDGAQACRVEIGKHLPHTLAMDGLQRSKHVCECLVGGGAIEQTE